MSVAMISAPEIDITQLIFDAIDRAADATHWEYHILPFSFSIEPKWE